MAVTSIWRVKGWLGKLVLYVENPDKTENPAFYQTEDRDTQGLSDVIAYAVQTEKTGRIQTESGEAVLQQFVSGVNCYPATAREEMLAVKRRFGKEDGTAAYHGYQSFAPGEATPELAHEIGVKLAQRLWGGKYQVLVATHLDRANHLHNHFVVNTVSFLDGIKYHRTAQDYREMQQVSDALCREYGLSVIENPSPGRSRQYGEWRAEQEGRPTWRGIVRADVDEAIRRSMTERQFFDHLKQKGYEIKTGKDISVRPPGKERFVRLMRNFGAEYSLETIRRRILEQSRPEPPLPEPKSVSRRVAVRGDLHSARKATGFRALYFHYCYLLGIFPKGRNQNNKRLHFLLKEDLVKMEAISEEMKLLGRNRIDTAEQLLSYKSGLERKIQDLTGQRAELYRARRRTAVRSDGGKLTEVKAETAALSKELAALRREVRLCDAIAVRSGVMREKIGTVREAEKAREGEKKRDDKFRRRG